MSALMKEKFKKYWTNVHGLMEVAMIIDPRYKLKFMKAFYSNIYMLLWCIVYFMSLCGVLPYWCVTCVENILEIIVC
jgi:hypothetical protein